MYPHLASVFIAVDASTRTNGCLRIIRGSHLLGRVEHSTVGGQTGADMQVVNRALKVLDHVYIEMDPGDALFFHCNTLHASGTNHSEHSRNVFLSCYNRTDNPPYKTGPNISHTVIDKLPDSMLTSYQARPVLLNNTGFYKPDFSPN